jgi:hypothetical protein
MQSRGVLTDGNAKGSYSTVAARKASLRLRTRRQEKRRALLLPITRLLGSPW